MKAAVQYKLNSWAVSFPDEARLKVLKQSKDPKPTVTLLRELCHVRDIITRDASLGVTWPAKLVAAVEVQWAGEFAESGDGAVLHHYPPHTS